MLERDRARFAGDLAVRYSSVGRIFSRGDGSRVGRTLRVFTGPTVRPFGRRPIVLAREPLAAASAEEADGVWSARRKQIGGVSR